jgi:formylglycine-generating enzyme required for sulfatase activity
MKEQQYQRSGMTDPNTIKAIGKATNAEFVLAGDVRSLGSANMFMASILNIEDGSQLTGDSRNYRTIAEGLQLMGELARALPGKGGGGQIPENFVRIEGGVYMIGSPPAEMKRESNEAQHRVTVGAFYMGKYEVTQMEYEEIMGTNPSGFKGANLPVEQVTWFDAREYCNKRSSKEGLAPAYNINRGRNDPRNLRDDTVKWQVTWNKTANGYRLPTEAEWEFACRAGVMGPFTFGDDINTNQANFNGNTPYANSGAKGSYRQRTTEVGTFPPNSWGLYDMHGNVWEWCWDWFGVYSMASQNNPTGPTSGAGRVLRGGSWGNQAQYLRSAYRSGNAPMYKFRHLGFRVVLPVS